MSSKAIIIGAGFSGLSAACSLAAAGFEVTVLEKNAAAGGRARLFEEADFRFDMGPSWYWMPDVFERFFQRFGKKVEDYYELKRLDPSYRVFFEDHSHLDLPGSREAVCDLFESIEPGAGNKLKKFLDEGAYKYKIGMEEMVYKPGLSWREFLDLRIAKGLFKLHLFQSFSKYSRKYFSNPKLLQLLEFPVLFLGAMPSKIPALYSLMNYADVQLGTWYPVGGMAKIPEAMEKLAKSLGVTFHFNTEVEKIFVDESSTAKIIYTSNGIYTSDVVVGGADYHHIEQNLLEQPFRSYSPEYWDSRVMAPSCLIYYLGINRKVKGLLHHNLFFDSDFNQHARQIYSSPEWPEKPLFYVCCPSKTDTTVAPDDCENLFILIPVAPGLKDSEEIREKYLKIVTQRIEALTGEEIHSKIIFKKSYAYRDFVKDYNSFKGNAYGLANTLKQTAIFRPSVRSKKVRNLYYTGQLTVPGPGVPPAIISGQIVADEIIRNFKNQTV